ncbi:MAG: CpsB/CapC family capsule biosynthesis tyrosine phosphatase [Candidatus Acidiferrales bacterium]
MRFLLRTCKPLANPARHAALSDAEDRGCVVIPSRLRYSAFKTMVDIHCHILPGLDDGAESFEVACAMAEMAIEDGITHVIGTPHASADHQFLPELVRERRDELQARFEGRLVLATGCDFHLSFENLQDIRQNPERFTLNQESYLLVEFADYSIPPSLDQALHELQLAGLRPIVTHPERNPLIRAQPDRLFRWRRQGCYVQVTAQSLLGKFGKAAQEAAEMWLDAGAVHFLASDAHNVTSRPLRLKECFDYVASTRGEDVAQALLIANPMAAFEGSPLPYVPELPDDAGTDDSSAPGGVPGRRKRFFFF